MQPVGLNPGQEEYSVDISPTEQGALELILDRLRSVQHPFLVNIYQYHSQIKPNATTRSYSIVADQVQESLQEVTNRRKQGKDPEITEEELLGLTQTCVNALAEAKKMVRARQDLQVKGLDLSAITYTRTKNLKVHLLEAVMSGYGKSIPEIVYEAVRYDVPPSFEDLSSSLSVYTSPGLSSLLSALSQPSPNYEELATQPSPSPAPIDCHSCRQSKVPTIPQICERHLFCSEECLKLVQEANGIAGTRCPLCTVKVVREKMKSSVLLKRKEAMNPMVEQKPEFSECHTCKKKFVNNPSEVWKLEFLGSAVYSQTGLYCSKGCYEASVQPRVVDKTPVNSGQVCIVCGTRINSTGITLHCRKHGLCSNACQGQYYHGEPISQHKFMEGFHCCYTCLEADLQDIGDAEQEQQYLFLKQKLAEFKRPVYQQPAGSGFEAPEPHQNHHSHHCRHIVECRNFISPRYLEVEFFQTNCLFCGKDIKVHKVITDGYEIDERTSFLMCCEYRIHGVCSRQCMRRNVIRDGAEALSVRCPKCPASMIHSEFLSLALTSRNPTQEFVRRTPVPVICGCQQGATVYCLDNCRHEMCGNRLDLYMQPDNSVKCNICGATSSFERMLQTEFTNVVKHADGE